MRKVRVLFVCTGNIFRSMSAEYCMKKYLRDNHINRFIVSSAGTEAVKQDVEPVVRDYLESLGVDVSSHVQRRLDMRILKENDIIVSMGVDHHEFILKNFGLNSFYFDEFAYGRRVGVRDVWEVVSDWKNHRVAADNHFRKVVKHIHDGIPGLVSDLLTRNFLFEDFINGSRSHANGFPFIPVLESKHSVAFMSIDVPKNHKWHILAVPRERFANLEEIPRPVLNDLINTVSVIGRVLKRSHGGYNVFLNNGVEAGQEIFHTHFHVIPRFAGDGINWKSWKKSDLSVKDFVKYSEELKALISGV